MKTLRTLWNIALAGLIAVAVLVVLAGNQPATSQSPKIESFVGPNSPEGTKPACDLPKQLRKENIKSPPGIGWGCCVFRSLDHAAHWQMTQALYGMPEWMAEKGIWGGGWPEKVDRLIPQIAKERDMETPDYLQIESGDLDILRLACKTGRMVSITYYWSPSGRYSGRHISHMVNLVHADNKWFAILDNNYIDQLEWLTEDEFKKASFSKGKYWAVILLDNPPPPIPRNLNNEKTPHHAVVSLANSSLFPKHLLSLGTL